MATITDAFATADELATKSQGAIAADNPDADRELEAASAKIRTFARWHIWPNVSQTLQLTGSGNARLFLPTLKLTAITSITDVQTVIDLDTLDWDEAGVVDAFGGRCWSTRRGKITAVIVHGYTGDDCPADIKDVALHMAARALGSPLGATKESAGGVAVSWSMTGHQTAGGAVLLESEQDDLAYYRLPGRL